MQFANGHAALAWTYSRNMDIGIDINTDMDMKTDLNIDMDYWTIFLRLSLEWK